MAQKAIFVGMDGVQLEKALLLGLRGEAQALNGLDIVKSYIGGTPDAQTEQVTSSGPGWSTLLSGVWVDQHGVASNNDAPIAEGVDSLFDRVDSGIANARIASIVNWSPINTGHFAREAGFLDEPGVIDIELHGVGNCTEWVTRP